MRQKYRLFSKEPCQVVRPKDCFARESQLRDFVAQHLPRLFHVTFLDTEYQVGRMYIDIVGITKDGRPVLIECKQSRGVGIVDQITSYYRRLQRNLPAFEALAKAKSKVRRINIDRPRLICLAKEFSDFQLGSYDERVDSGDPIITNIEFVAYSCFAHNVMLLDWLRGSQPDGDRPGPPERNNSLNYIISVCGKDTFEFFKDLNADIMSLGKDVFSKDNAMLRSFDRKGKVFAYLRPVPRRNQMRAWFKLNPQNEGLVPGILRDVSRIGKLPPSGFDLEMLIANNKSQRQRAMELFRKAYDQAN